MSRDHNAGRCPNTKTDNSTFERVEEFRYLGKTITNQNSIQEVVKGRLKSSNACYHSVQNLLSSTLPSIHLKIKKYRNIILRLVLYGFETWLLTLREDCMLRVFENRVLKRIFEPKRDKVRGRGENYIMRNLIICTIPSIFFGW